MGDRPGSPSWVRMSEDKVRRKDLCGSVRAIYVLEKLSDVSGPGLVEAGRYRKGLYIRLFKGRIEQRRVQAFQKRFAIVTDGAYSFTHSTYMLNLSLIPVVFV